MSDPLSAPTRPVISDEHRIMAMRAVNRPRGRLGFLWEWAKSFVIAVALFLVIRTFLVEAFKIPTGSMERTLQVGDFLLVNKAVYGAEIPLLGMRLPRLEPPQRGDVIVFEFPEDQAKNFVKRLIGLPGDTVEMRDGSVFLNGTALAEPYVIHSVPNEDHGNDDFGWQRDYLVKRAGAFMGDHPSRNNWGPLVVPEGKYFVLGDNRDNSYDSRYWGFVPDSLVKGRPLLIYYSYERDAEDRVPWLTRIRWSRLGERIH